MRKLTMLHPKTSMALQMNNHIPPYLCVWPKPGAWIPTSYVVDFFVFCGFRWGVIVQYFYIGGIVDQQCWNFLFTWRNIQSRKSPTMFHILKLLFYFIRFWPVFFRYFVNLVCWDLTDTYIFRVKCLLSYWIYF